MTGRAGPCTRARLLPLRQTVEQALVPTRNAGLDAADAEVLGRIDADSVPAPDRVEQVQRAFADPHLAAVSGPVVVFDLPLPRLGPALASLGRRPGLESVPKPTFP